MNIYLVGGAIRDALLGRPGADRDWVVVGATPEEMVARGFLPVGRDFPVFLHPQTREEYALARTERKSAPGYRGFTIHAAPGVTLEEDLARRDLTINSIALPAELAGAAGRFDLEHADKLIDPFDGRRDLQARVLRHVTGAFREDPVRILRVARLAARFADFSVAPETMALMREMVASGEVDALVAERVWQELARGLMEASPSRMLEVLRDCGALARLLPEIDPHADRLRVLDAAAALAAPLAVRFACLTRELDARQLRSLCARWRVPVELRELAELVAREHGHIERSGELSAAALVQLLERCDAFRKPKRFADTLLACECDARERLRLQQQQQQQQQQQPQPQPQPHAQRQRLLAALAAAQAVATEAIAAEARRSGAAGPRIGEAIRRARIDAVAAVLQA